MLGTNDYGGEGGSEMLKMNENLRWLAINAPDWDNNFDRIARGSVGVDWFSSESFPG